MIQSLTIFKNKRKHTFLDVFLIIPYFICTFAPANNKIG